MRLKKCSKCGKELPLDKFYKYKQSKDGYRSICKDCWKQDNHNYYVNHREDIIENAQKYVDKNREKVREYQNKYSKIHKEERKKYLKDLSDEKREVLNTFKYPCVKCGEKRPWVIDFHHINPENKSFGISDRYRGSIESIKLEIEKCVCLCRNCHAEFHWIYGVSPKDPEESLNEYLYKE